MRVWRYFLTFCLVLPLEACAIPAEELTSLLASQGVVSPSYIDQRRVTRDGSWFVTSRDAFRQIAPEVCKTTERYFSVYDGSSGHRIEPGAVTQMIALKNCNATRMNDFVSVGLPYRLGMTEPDFDELDDEILLKFVETVFVLPKMAAASEFAALFHYDADQNANELQTILRNLNPRTLRDMSIYRTLDAMEAIFPIDTEDTGEMLSVHITFKDYQVTEVSVAAVIFIS